MDWLTNYHLGGVVIGISTFLIIGLFQKLIGLLAQIITLGVLGAVIEQADTGILLPLRTHCINGAHTAKL